MRVLGQRVSVVMLLMCAGALPGIAGQSNATANPRIVFVCEHGAALSVVSAAYFNKIARQEHLPLHAIARGANPQKEIAISARQGLTADGVPFAPQTPQPLSIKEAAQARRVIAFCPLPARYSKLAPVESWSDVPPTAAGYALARDAILRHLHELFGQLKNKDKDKENKDENKEVDEHEQEYDEDEDEDTASTRSNNIEEATQQKKIDTMKYLYV